MKIRLMVFINNDICVLCFRDEDDNDTVNVESSIFTYMRRMSYLMASGR